MTQKRKPQRAWTNRELEEAKKLTAAMSYARIAERLGRTKSSVAGALYHDARREAKCP